MSFRIRGQIARPPRLHTVVAEKIQEMISEEALQPLSRLPPERVLSEQFGVSRTVIREALKVLVTRGVLKEVPGKGTLVWQNVTEPLTDLLHGFIARSGPRGQTHLFEVRRVLEVEIAGLAAERAEPEEVDHLERINRTLERMNREPEPWAGERLRRYNELEFDFHLTLARCTKNELFVILLSALSGAFHQSWACIHNRPETRKQGVELHRKILKAVREKDSRAARQATDNNLEAFLQASLEPDPEKARNHQERKPGGLSK
ncbi:MAG: FadR family transcriptional regulator [Bryobacterales bacterium]|nr:FadR family transcriptional regulator [Bryobacterales bacterium]MEB2363012.1 FadR/GntR family transcriptional regulator [Bryobacterales bacterium]